MFTKRTVIGTVVGGIIMTVGIIAFIMSIGLQTISIDDTYRTGDRTSYKFDAPANSKQTINITGKSFNVRLSTPGNGLQIPLNAHTNNASLDWVHLKDGQSILQIQNTGNSDLYVGGTVQITTDPIYFTYHVLVIISGVIIIGFSAGFSVRKPRGF